MAQKEDYDNIRINEALSSKRLELGNKETSNREHKFCNANAIKTHIQGIRDILTKDSPKQREACKIEQKE